jgi:hypothetical protein
MNIRMLVHDCLFLRFISFDFRLEADCLTGCREPGSFFKYSLSGPEVNRVERLLTVCRRDEYELVWFTPDFHRQGFLIQQKQV